MIESTDEEEYCLNDMYKYRVGCDSNKMRTGMRHRDDALIDPLESILILRHLMSPFDLFCMSSI